MERTGVGLLGVAWGGVGWGELVRYKAPLRARLAGPNLDKVWPRG